MKRWGVVRQERRGKEKKEEEEKEVVCSAVWKDGVWSERERDRGETEEKNGEEEKEDHTTGVDRIKGSSEKTSTSDSPSRASTLSSPEDIRRSGKLTKSFIVTLCISYILRM